MIRQALAQVLGPLFEPGFSRFSYGFRPRRGAQDAVRQAREYLKEGYAVAVEMDLAKFFDSVNFDVLICRVSAKVPDLSVQRLISVRTSEELDENERFEPGQTWGERMSRIYPSSGLRSFMR